MTEFVGIISAKGGVGKTTTTINLSSALHFFNRNVIAVDANFANPDLGIHLGVPVVSKTLHTALRRQHDIKESVYRHPSGLRIIPGSISYKEARIAKRENLLDLIYGRGGPAEAVVIDSTPGLGGDSRAVIKACDHLIIVTTPDLVSVTGSLKMIKFAREEGKDVYGVIINKKRHEDYELADRNIGEFLQKPILGIIPEDIGIKRAMHRKTTLVHSDPNAPASIGFKKVAGLLIGQKYEETVEKKEKSALAQIIENLGFK